MHKTYPEIELEDKIQGNLLTITKYIEKSREIPIIAITANAFAEDVQDRKSTRLNSSHRT